MTKYLNSSFNSGANSSKFVDNWDRVFGNAKCLAKDVECKNKPMDGEKFCKEHLPEE